MTFSKIPCSGSDYFDLKLWRKLERVMRKHTIMTRCYIGIASFCSMFLMLLALVDFFGAGRSLERGACGPFLDCVWLGLVEVRLEFLGEIGADNDQLIPTQLANDSIVNSRFWRSV
jgi:hypothetical protein